MKTLQVIGYLLDYPVDDAASPAGEAARVLGAEGRLSDATLAALVAWIEHEHGRDILDRQEEYVALFDRTPALSLYLFEHVHGDSRHRGRALVELDELYRESGLDNVSAHTPDYLPLFLEYLSTVPPERGREHLDGAVEILAALGERLRRRASGYALLFDALGELAGRTPDAVRLAGALAAQGGHEPSGAELDAAWEQQCAFAGPTTGRAGGVDVCNKMETRP